MQHPSNQERAESAAEPLARFAAEREILAENTATQVADLIGNLLHHAEGAGLNPFDIARTALATYVEECLAPDSIGRAPYVALHISGGGLQPDDRRYEIRTEFCGHPINKHVVRFCGEWVGAADTRPSADAIMLQHQVRAAASIAALAAA